MVNNNIELNASDSKNQNKIVLAFSKKRRTIQDNIEIPKVITDTILKLFGINNSIDSEYNR